MRVLVTDGDNRAALAVTRSLGRAGHEVLVGEKHTPSLAHTSRYCASRIVYPDPVTASAEFIDYLSTEVREREIAVIVPIADIATFLVTEHRDRFGPHCAIPFASAATVARAADKVDLFERAKRLGVAVPASVVVRNPNEVPEIGLDYPIVVKPWRSRIRTPNSWVSTSVSYARDRAELMRDLSSRPQHEFPVMLQERIFGPGMGVFACYHQDRAVALFGHRRVTERPPWGGVSVLSESVAVSPIARDYAVRLLDDLGWHGVAMVEFKQDNRDQIPKLMEINGRFWGSLQLAVDAGLDFPALLLQTINPGLIAPQEPYRIGVRTRWFWGTVDSLLLTLLPGRSAPTGAPASRLRAVLEFMKVWGRRLYYDNPKWDDSAPFLFETKGWLRRTARAAGPDKTVAVPASAPRPAHTRLRTGIASSLQETGLDQDSWNTLAAQSNTNTIFQTHQWMRSWCAVFGDQYRSLLVTVSDGDRVVGVAPLMIDHRRPYHRTIRFMSDGRADYCDFLSGSEPGDMLAAVFERLAAVGGWDAIKLNNVPAESPTVKTIGAICASLGLPLLISDQFVCPALVVQGHEADARRILTKGSLQRRLNQFQRLGEVVARDMRTSAEIDPLLDTFFDQHVARRGLTRHSSLFKDTRNRRFYRDLSANLDGTNWLLFSAIELNGQPIAFHYGFDYNGVVTWYKPSFDVAHRARSPGLLMVRHLIGYTIGQGRHELDFTIGDEPFKSRFTNTTRKTVEITICRNATRLAAEKLWRKVKGARRAFSPA